MACQIDNTRKTDAATAAACLPWEPERQSSEWRSHVRILALIALTAIAVSACDPAPRHYAYGPGKAPTERVTCEYAKRKIEELSRVAALNQTTRFDDELEWYRTGYDRHCNEKSPSDGSV